VKRERHKLLSARGMSEKMTANGIRSQTPMPAPTRDVFWNEVVSSWYFSDWCGHEFESHSQPFLLTYLGLIKAYEVLSSFFQWPS